jgi:plastocyanin
MIATLPRVLVSTALAVSLGASASGRGSLAAAQGRGGTIKGRVRLTGKSPGNAVIRMGVDPMCRKLNAGKLAVQEVVVTSPDGGLANVFVRLQGVFPRKAPPQEPVVIDQRLCFYVPRVVGAQVGQTVQIRNSDSLLHNVRSLSSGGNSFNIGQPLAGMVYAFQVKDESGMLQVKCDLHRWMTLFIGVVDHPYFAVSGTGGTFEIANVPAGTYTIETWHERYGTLTKPLRVAAGATATVEFAYTGAEKPPASLD